MGDSEIQMVRMGERRGGEGERGESEKRKKVKRERGRGRKWERERCIQRGW